ncbi:MAG: PhoPQ-activated pathogenicity-related family protein [Bryobacteraceae bacterium]|nr:PhoPQ-activated pathogenicity-related family protein [Bryobacteraceae bacterium]MDW8378674.1 PhoPQ-activated pathogenicity-related family protein [Bryobacterales bacterium]
MKCVLSLFLFVVSVVAAETALDRYVKAPDSHYKYEVVKTIPGKDYTVYVVELTSQAWLTEKEVDKPVWKHWLTIVKPDRVDHSVGFLVIGGGSNRDRAPERADGFITQVATITHSVAAELRNVPNQPLTFVGDGKPRSEDSIIAFAWAKFLHGGSELWLPRLPMTKSAVRAMDTVTAVMAQQGGTKVDRFVVTGGSKRGWTTWTTAATDSRVVAIVPAVIDLLNIEPSFRHHWQVYGAWSPAVKDYYENDIMRWSGTPRYREMLKIVEPYEYRDRLTMPKYIVNATGDEFFLPDSSQFYFKDLKGEKHLRYVPNTKHSLAGSDARETIGAFYSMVLNNRPRPRYEWKFEKNGAIVVKTTDRPTEVKLWQATNPEKRDFRLDVIGKAFQATVLQEARPGVYVGKVPKPAKGWTAYFVELTYPSGISFPLKVTTGVRVIPDVYPYKAPKLGSAAGPGPTSIPPAEPNVTN